MDGKEDSHKREAGRRQNTTKRRRKHGRKRSPAFFIIKSVILVCLCSAVLFMGIFAIYVRTCIIPNCKIDISEISLSQSSVLYHQDSEGNWQTMETLHGGTNSIWTDYSSMPKYLEYAAVAIEDKRFYDHNGVDWWRTGGAVVNMFTNARSTFGGSTLTQQTIKNITGEKEGTVKRKILEIFRAMEFEKSHSKEEIIELYLNNIYLGEGCTGVETAAKAYFGKNVTDLTLAECADLIGITNNPSLYDPYISDAAKQRNKERQETILSEMLDQGYISQQEYDEAMAQQLVFTSGDEEEEDDSSVYSYFVDQVISDVIADLQEEKGYTYEVAEQMLFYGGLNIYCTEDTQIQTIVDDIYSDRSNLPYSSGDQQMQSAITIIDPYTGDIVAMAGGMGEKVGSRSYNRATALRQCGSAIKPIAVYAPALDNGTITPASAIDDAPVREINGKAWPVNSEGYYSGLTTVDEALRESINTCAVRTVEALGVQESYNYMTQKLGFNTLVSDDINSASMGLGGLTNGVNTVEMAAAYAAFANDGIYTEPRTYSKVTNQKDEVVLDNTSDSWVAMKETTAYFMNNYLRKVVTSGTGGAANFSGMTVAGKTGTTTKNYDRYFVGYTPYYVAAVWTGYDINTKINTSGNPSARLFRAVMSRIHENLPNKSFDTPANGLTTVTVCEDSGLRANDLCSDDVRGSRVRTVEVATGTEPSDYCGLHVAVSWCTVGNGIATDYCPEADVVTRSVLDYHRTGVAASAGCSDSAYLLGHLGSCTAHDEASILPPDPNLTDPENPDGVDPGTDPEDPGVDPEDPNNNGDVPITDPLPEDTE